MANKRPNVDWEKMSYPPQSPAVNIVRDGRLSEADDEENCAFYKKGDAACGGNGRKYNHPELGPIHRKGPTIFQTILVSEVKLGGQTGRETAKRRRVDLTAEDAHNIIQSHEKTGKKPPYGLTLEQVHTVFQTLSERKIAICQNTRDIAQRAEKARRRYRHSSSQIA